MSKKRNGKVSFGKVFLGMCTGGLSLPFTGIRKRGNSPGYTRKYTKQRKGTQGDSMVATLLLIFILFIILISMILSSLPPQLITFMLVFSCVSCSAFLVWTVIKYFIKKKYHCSAEEYFIRKIYLNPKDEFLPPDTAWLQKKLAKILIDNINFCMLMANSSTYIPSFIDYYEEAVNDLSKLSQCKKVLFKEQISTNYWKYYKLEDEFQWHLCDAIKRSKEQTISDIREKYKNSREFQERALQTYEKSISYVRSKFSEQTAAFADSSIQDVRNALGFLPSSPPIVHPTEIYAVDCMEGHEFEHWCASLLQRNGFTDVSVTKGSGDQGVDIVASKDGIRYAIQCKCYSSNLGNTPVQQVHAGKALYRCQVGVVMTNQYFTPGAVELAQATGVLLWDRDKLKQMMESAAP